MIGHIAIFSQNIIILVLKIGKYSQFLPMLMGENSSNDNLIQYPHQQLDDEIALTSKTFW